jgi:leucyl/phenylalanyl-tRNA--protein transferase
MFAGESMFYEQANASKLALCFLVDFLRERGATWIDCQVMTPLFKSFGAREVARDEFLDLLSKALSREPPLFVRSNN